MSAAIMGCQSAPQQGGTVSQATTGSDRQTDIQLSVESLSGHATYLDPAYTPEKQAQYQRQGRHFAVSAQGVHTAQAAQEIYRKSGNLIDAAVAASFVVSVERPHSTGIGGGGFLLYRDGKTRRVHAVDFREKAPHRATRDMYLNEDESVVQDASVFGGLAVATPGMVAGLLEIHRKFGKLPLAKVMEPAIRLAEEGFEVYPRLAEALEGKKHVLVRYPASRAIFLKPDGSALATGDVLIQKDLAKTLRDIAKLGKTAFYSGATAKAIARAVQDNGGILSEQDLARYQVKWPTALHGTFKGYDLYQMPPPSSGGVHVIQILNILESDPLKSMGFHSAQSIHLMASAMQVAFADRAEFLGDPAFTKVPVEGLISKMYAGKLRAQIPLDRIRRANEIKAGDAEAFSRAFRQESHETTHISMMDGYGSMIATTQTINGHFGSGLVAEGTGVLLNNEMDDFSTKPGVPNIYGAVGKEANAVAPNKTPLSSMSPTLILKKPASGRGHAEPVMAIGAPGGTRIITCVTQVILNVLEYGLDLFPAVLAPRFHFQWLPDQIDMESGFSTTAKESLGQLGYKQGSSEVHCRVMAVTRDAKRQLEAVSDPRDYGAVLAY